MIDESHTFICCFKNFIVEALIKINSFLILKRLMTMWVYVIIKSCVGCIVIVVYRVQKVAGNIKTFLCYTTLL